MLKIENLCKRYGNSKDYTLHNLNLELKPGEIFGFLGPNGAGKSTTIKSVVGILPFDEGHIYINGIDIKEDPQNSKMNLGYISDNHAVFERLTGREYVNHIANLYKVPLEERDQRAMKFVKMFNLEKAYDSPIKSYSHGMKQKITVVAALVHNPKLWVLDEPLLGLDPQSAYQLKKVMKEHAEAGNTVFFSSHILEVVEALCDRVAILKKGVLQGIYDLHEMKKNGESLEELFIGLVGEGVEDGFKNTEVPSSKETKTKGEKTTNTRKTSGVKNNKKGATANKSGKKTTSKGTSSTRKTKSPNTKSTKVDE